MSVVWSSWVIGARTWSTLGLQSSTFLNLQHNQTVVDHDGCLIAGPDRPDRCKPGTGRMVTWDIDNPLFLFRQIASLYPSCPVGHHHHVSLRRCHESRRNQPTIRRPTIGIYASSNCAAGGFVHYYQGQGHLPGRLHLLFRPYHSSTRRRGPKPSACGAQSRRNAHCMRL
jgi:hypothetical protein